MTRNAEPNVSDEDISKLFKIVRDYCLERGFYFEAYLAEMGFLSLGGPEYVLRFHARAAGERETDDAEATSWSSIRHDLLRVLRGSIG